MTNRRVPNLRYKEVKTVLPLYFQEEYPNLISFLETYYEVEDIEKDLFKLRDLEETNLKYLDILFFEIVNKTVNKHFLDPRLAGKVISFILKNKGNEYSAQLFFRLFFNEVPTIEYPKDKLFIVAESFLNNSGYIIQDGAKYQFLSILIKSGVSFSKWETLYRRFIHPAGYYLSGEIFIETSSGLSITAPIVILDSDVGNYILENTADIISSGLGEIILSEDIYLNSPHKNINKYAGVSIDVLNKQYEAMSDMNKAASQLFSEDSDGNYKSLYLSSTVETMDNYNLIEWDILSIFDGGLKGVVYDLSDISKLYQDSAGGTLVASAGDEIGTIIDISPNNINAIQATSAARPLYAVAPGRGVFNKTSSNMSMDFSGTGGFTANLIQFSDKGIVNAIVNVPDSDYSFAINPAYFPDDNIRGYVLVEGELSSAQLDLVKEYFRDGNSKSDFSDVVSMTNWFRGRTDLISLDATNWDTSSVTSMYTLFYNCSSLTSVDVSNWDTSSVTNMGYLFRDCSSLTSLDVSNWDTSSVTSMYTLFYNCSSLTSLTINGGTGNPFADSPNTDYTSAFTNTNLNQTSIDDVLVAIESAGTSNGTFNQSGGSAPSATGEAAITALRGRGWTVTVTGGF